ncbi:MAG: ATP synthase F1 subunit epsilon [Pirellulaceae bacterium]
MSEAKKTGLQVVVVTPEKTALDVPADFVALPLIDGEIGVLKDHAPTIGRLGFGEMRVRLQNKTDHYYVDGGFMQIADNVVSVLTGRAMLVDELNAEEIRFRLEEAEAKSDAKGAEAALRRQTIDQAKAQLRILEKA